MLFVQAIGDEADPAALATILGILCEIAFGHTCGNRRRRCAKILLQTWRGEQRRLWNCRRTLGGVPAQS